MTPDFNKIYVGDNLATMRSWPDAFVQTCVTSPPYFGLRDYGHAGQIGLEETPDAFVARLVEVFREVRRVLRDDGTLWLNIGDSYNSRPGGPQGDISGRRGRAFTAEQRKWRNGAGRADGKIDDRGQRNRDGVSVPGPKGKDLIGVPWMLAFALRADGWYLRQDIIWAKPNPMPESVTDRCTKAHEYLFLLSKSQQYYFDQEAIAEPFADSSLERLRQDLEGQKGSNRVPGKTNGPMKAVGLNKNRKSYKPGSASSMNADQHIKKSDAGLPVREAGRNKRSVWTVTTTPFKEAHFATFPPNLIKPCVLAGAPPHGVVLDPFMGAGTTALVAATLNRQFVGCELNPEYIKIAEKRIASELAQQKLF